MDYARRTHSLITSGVLPSSAQRVRTEDREILAQKACAFVERGLSSVAVVLLSLLLTAGALAAPREPTPRQILSVASRVLPAMFTQSNQDLARFSLLKELAAQALRQDPAFLGRVRFSVDEKEQTFSIDLGPVPADLVLSKSDADAPALEALIRLAALQRDLQVAFSGVDSWRPELDAVDQAAGRCMQATGSDAANTCRDQLAASFSTLGKALSAFATGKGLKQRDDRTRGVPGYPVHVTVVPPNARLRVMTLLEYKKSQYLQKPKEQYEWIDLMGSTFQMIGRYRYRVEWPVDLNGPEEGELEITGPQTLTFTPSR